MRLCRDVFRVWDVRAPGAGFRDLGVGFRS